MAPFGRGASIRHVLGNAIGGGYEWIASPRSDVKVGATAMELDGSGKIVRMTVVYDGRHLSKGDRRSLLDVLAD